MIQVIGERKSGSDISYKTMATGNINFYKQPEKRGPLTNKVIQDSQSRSYESNG